ncbi:hypothetical protein INT46_000956 [Mucor plumbeus]|uniref:Uncharacterized protein n=1 Tax=Mucor plumbeus TaxID=97098 RepID=A0A8H7RH90_9FUNG|nr:hypothetical protein INT46_000956 [Mucor plumbeus]
MNFFPSPPSSPQLTSSNDKVMCGSCNKTLSSDWFCADCHTKCSTCNRFLSNADYCTRCWSFDQHNNRLVRKPSAYHQWYQYQQQLKQWYYWQQQQQQQQLTTSPTK